MAVKPIPDTLCLIERGWLSSNVLVGFDSNTTASIVDAGYVTQSQDLVQQLKEALAGRALQRIIVTHLHSDHIGGVAALQAAWPGQATTIIPAGAERLIDPWDEAALLLGPMGQQAAPFRHDEVIKAGDHFRFGDLDWQAHPAPGHDALALMYACADHGLLISGDALWENGFGVVFASLFDEGDDGAALNAARTTLERIAVLKPRWVIPGHGPAFCQVDAALARAFKRLDGFCDDRRKLAAHAVKVGVVFNLLAAGGIDAAAFDDTLASWPALCHLGERWLGLDVAALATWLIDTMTASGAIERVDGRFIATAR